MTDSDVTESSHASCDLTHFDGNWPRFKAELGLTYCGRAPGRCNAFVWTARGLTVDTHNNPETGEYSQPNRRDDEPGYASYIGASGDPARIREFREALKRHATWRKSPITHDRSYC